jgi:hypothetical protein
VIVLFGDGIAAHCARGWADRSIGFPMRKATPARGGGRGAVMGYGARMPLQELGLRALNGIRGFFGVTVPACSLFLVPIASAEKSPVLTCRILAVTPLSLSPTRGEKSPDSRHGRIFSEKWSGGARSAIVIGGSILGPAVLFATGCAPLDRRYSGPTRANSRFEIEGIRLWLSVGGCSINTTG